MVAFIFLFVLLALVSGGVFFSTRVFRYANREKKQEQTGLDAILFPYD